MQAVRRCQVDAKPKSGDITYMREEKLANQKPEENWKRHILGNGSTTTVAQHKGVIHVDDNKVELLVNITLE